MLILPCGLKVQVGTCAFGKHRRDPPVGYYCAVGAVMHVDIALVGYPTEVVFGGMFYFLDSLVKFSFGLLVKQE